ncbi:MAG: NADH-quinone oxidoreductase subunit C [Alphaproteobacteria bacterium]
MSEASAQPPEMTAAVLVSPSEWESFAEDLAKEHRTLVDLWGDGRHVRLAMFDADAVRIEIVALACPDGTFPSVGRHHAPAIRLERTIRDLYGLASIGAPDERRWLDHGVWPVRQPLGARQPHEPATDAYTFLPVGGEGLHQIPVGPVHAGIIEPGHFRFTCSGETVVRLEERLGYVHKGIEALMRGAAVETAARLASRTSGDSTVAYAIAFAHAVETALGIVPPARAVWLRAVMAELERIANHLGDIGAICNDAAFSLMHAHCGVLRERVLREAGAAFGHRLMMDRVIPGGVAADLDTAGLAALHRLIVAIRREFATLVSLFEETNTLQDRTVGTGILSPDLARRFAAGGYVGRASDRDFDARKTPGYPPYDILPFTVPVLFEGDVNARVWVRIREVEQSLDLLDQLLGQLPAGPLHAPLAGRTGEGVALVEGFRGDIFCWVRLDASGRIEHCRLRDPSWFQWPLLEAVIEDNIVADFPLCNKSFNCSYSGHDL